MKYLLITIYLLRYEIYTSITGTRIPVNIGKVLVKKLVKYWKEIDAQELTNKVGAWNCR